MPGEKIFEFDRTAYRYHPANHFETIKAMDGDMTRIYAFHRELDEAYYRDLKAVISSEGLSNPDEVIGWAKKMTREHKAKQPLTVDERAAERIFILRLLRGLEEM